MSTFAIQKQTIEPQVQGRLSEVFSTSQGEGPYVGRRHVFVRLAGCTIGCRFCDTPDSLRPGDGFVVHDTGEESRRIGNPIAANRAASLIRQVIDRNRPVHAVSITGGEPLEQVEFLHSLLVGLRGTRRLLETAGTLPDELARVIGEVEIVSMDLKLPSVTRVADHFAAHRRFLAIALQREVYVKVVVSPRLDEDDWRRAVDCVVAVAPGIPFIIQPETSRAGGVTLPFERLQTLSDAATSAGLDDVRIIPQVHKFLDAP